MIDKPNPQLAEETRRISGILHDLVEDAGARGVHIRRITYEAFPGEATMWGRSEFKLECFEDSPSSTTP